MMAHKNASRGSNHTTHNNSNDEIKIDCCFKSNISKVLRSYVLRDLDL